MVFDAAGSGTRVAVSVMDAGRPLDEQVTAATAAGADTVELRVDAIGDVDAVDRFLEQRGKRGAGVAPANGRYAPTTIVTVRDPTEGGQWTGDEAARVAAIQRLARHRDCLLDIEHATWQREPALRAAIGPAERLILSHHDLAGTPVDLAAVFDRLASETDAILKAVFTPRDATDACRVLDELRRRSATRRVIALAMGEAGLMTRVLAGKFGKFLTFAATQRGAESAVGQPTLEELLGLYRFHKIGPATHVFGVVGWPVAHSQSPLIHNAAMAADGIDGVYLPLPVLPTYDAFAAFADYATENTWLDLSGLSVTIPHKEHACRWLIERGYTVSDLARRCGAVNTLVRTADGTWRGENTDGLGLVAALESLESIGSGGLRGRRVEMLGAGGVARGAAGALLERGCSVRVHNRTAERAGRLAGDLGCEWKPWERRGDGEADILINCTSIGMSPDTDAMPLDTARLRSGTVVCDTVYTPPDTRLLREARAAGCAVVDGREMFVRQAAEQYTLWHRRAVDSARFRAALRPAGPP